MTTTLVITSGKGGVGKTNISVNTALELARRNFKTCLFDADLGLANVNILLGIHPDTTLDDCINGEKKLDEVILHSNFDIDIIPGSSGIETTANLGQEKIDDLIASFSQLTDYDYFLIDTSSGISRGVISFCLASNETILVITSEATSLADGYALLKVMASNGYKGTVKIVVNRCPDIPKSKATFLRMKKAVDKHLGIDIAPVGTILNDPNFETAITHQEPILTLYPNSIASQCIRAMVSTLIQDTTQEDDDFGSFWQRYYEFAQSDLILPDKVKRIKTNKSSSHPEHDKDSPPTTTTDTQAQPPVENNTAADIPETPLPLSFQNDNITDSLYLASPLPLLSKSLELHGRGELTEDKLTKIFSSDPALMVKAMKMLQSSGNISSKRTTRLQQIFKELGPEVLSTILVTTSMKSAHLEPGSQDPHFLDAFWCHSYKCALLAEFIAELIDYPYPEEAFLAGLLHDIGRLTLQTKYPKVYAKFPYSFAHDEVVDTERRIFGTTHAEIGAEVLRAWRLNSFMADTIHYHAESELRIETAFDLVKIVFVASQLTGSKQLETMKSAGLKDPIFGLTSAQLLTGLEMAELRAKGLADHFHNPLREMAAKNSTEETRTLFRQQALEYSLLQGTMPSHAPVRELPQLIQQLHHGLDILFGIQPVLCLLTDKQRSHLKAVGYPDCFGWETLADILLPLGLKKSLIVKTFSSGKLHYAISGEAENVLSLADEQVMRSLGTNSLVCIPMTTQGISKGVIVFGMQKEELQSIDKLQISLEQFGAQAAMNLFASEQLTRETQNAPHSVSEKKAARGNLIHLAGGK